MEDGGTGDYHNLSICSPLGSFVFTHGRVTYMALSEIPVHLTRWLAHFDMQGAADANMTRVVWTNRKARNEVQLKGPQWREDSSHGN